MASSKRFTFISSADPSRSRRVDELQRSKARSHAALVGHQRSRSGPRDDGSTASPPNRGRGQTVVLRFPPPPRPPGNGPSHTNTASTTPLSSNSSFTLFSNNVSPSGASLSWALPLDAVDHYLLHGNDDPSRGAISEIAHVLGSIPASPHPKPSLQQFFEANPFFFLPAQIMLDAGNPYAVAFFSTVDFQAIYHAVMGVFLTWLSTQYPSLYPLSAALHHQGRAIPILRRRLTQGLYNDETYLSVLCAMQTEALMGNEYALTAHQSGLETLSRVMTGKLNDYCRSMRTRHDYLVKKSGQPPPFPPESTRKSSPLRYLSLPYHQDVIEMISALPPVVQELAYQQHAISLDMMAYLAGFSGWANQALTNLSPTSRARDTSTGGPIYAMLSELWRILKGLDPLSALLEKLLCIAHYLMMMSSYYRRIVQRRRIFQSLRAEATEIAMKYQPRNQPERDNLIIHSMLIVQTWKSGGVLENEGIDLLNSLKERFPEARQWETLETTLRKFPSIAPAMAEKKDCWRQSCSRPAHSF